MTPVQHSEPKVADIVVENKVHHVPAKAVEQPAQEKRAEKQAE